MNDLPENLLALRDILPAPLNPNLRTALYRVRHCPGIYAIWTDDVCQYIGASQELGRRATRSLMTVYASPALKDERTRSKWFMWLATTEQPFEAEAWAIRCWKPALNKTAMRKNLTDDFPGCPLKVFPLFAPARQVEGPGPVT